MADSSVKDRLDRNIQAFVESGAQAIPVLISPGFDTVVGRPENEETLLRMLQDELFNEETQNEHTQELGDEGSGQSPQ